MIASRCLAFRQELRFRSPTGIILFSLVTLFSSGCDEGHGYAYSGYYDFEQGCTLRFEKSGREKKLSISNDGDIVLKSEYSIMASGAEKPDIFLISDEGKGYRLILHSKNRGDMGVGRISEAQFTALKLSCKKSASHIKTLSR